MRGRALVILALTWAVFPGWACAECRLGEVAVKDAIFRAFTSTVEAPKEMARQQSTVPADRQVGAPSASGAGVGMVDHASFPAIIGGALDQGLVRAGQGTATLSLNAFAFLALAHPDYVTNQSEYEHHEGARRLGGAITLGGKGQGFDGKGSILSEAATAKNLEDIVDVEVRVRVWGNTDRRYDKNALMIDAMGSASLEAVSESARKFLVSNFDEIQGLVTDPKTGCGYEEKVKNFLRDHKSALAATSEDVQEAVEALGIAGEKIDRQWVWTLVAGGTRRKTEFGLNALRAGLHVDLGKFENHQSTLNLDWIQAAALPDGSRPTRHKLAYEHSYVWKKGSAFAPDGIDISASLSIENDRDVPDAKHPSNVKANVKLEYPVSKAIKIPVSLSWANHEDLLTGEKNIRGHIGFTVDFSKLAAADAAK